jgi:hypothetical protein
LHLQSPRSSCPPVFLSSGNAALPSISALASLFHAALPSISALASLFLLHLLSAAYYLRHWRPSPSFSKPSGDVSTRSTACANDHLSLESPARSLSTCVVCLCCLRSRGEGLCECASLVESNVPVRSPSVRNREAREASEACEPCVRSLPCEFTTVPSSPPYRASRVGLPCQPYESQL